MAAMSSLLWKNLRRILRDMTFTISPQTWSILVIKELLKKRSSAALLLAAAVVGGSTLIPSASAGTDDSGNFYINATDMSQRSIGATVGKSGRINNPETPGNEQPDGIIESVSIPFSIWTDITYGNGEYLAVASAGAYQVMTSPDGRVWTTQTAPARSWKSVTYGNGRYVAVSQDGETMTSVDGRRWIEKPKTVDVLNTVSFGAGIFVAGGRTATGSALLWSTDGSTWTASTLPSGTEITNGKADFSDSTFIDGKFYVVSSGNGYQGQWRSSVLLTATNGKTWTKAANLPNTVTANYSANALFRGAIYKTPAGVIHSSFVPNQWMDGAMKLFKPLGTGWEEISVSGLPTLSSGKVQVIGTRDNELLATVNKPTTDPIKPEVELYSSSNGGANWIKVGKVPSGIEMKTASNADCTVGLLLGGEAAMLYCS